MTPISLTRASFLHDKIIHLLPEYKVPYDSEEDTLFDQLMEIDDSLCKHLNGLVIEKDIDGLRREVALLLNPKKNENV